MIDTCCCCGEYVGEGRQVCTQCMSAVDYFSPLFSEVHRLIDKEKSEMLIPKKETTTQGKRLVMIFRKGVPDI